MSKYRVYFNEVYENGVIIDHYGVSRLIDVSDIFEAMVIAHALAKELGCHSYRILEGGAYRSTAAFCRWQF